MIGIARKSFEKYAHLLERMRIEWQGHPAHGRDAPRHRPELRTRKQEHRDLSREPQCPRTFLAGSALADGSATKYPENIQN